MITLLGAKLRRLREQKGLNQSECAQALGFSEHSKGYISEIESGKKLPSAEIVVRIAHVFGVSTDYLLWDTIPVQGNED